LGIQGPAVFQTKCRLRRGLEAAARNEGIPAEGRRATVTTIPRIAREKESNRFGRFEKPRYL
jgi:hypothetical protein